MYTQLRDEVDFLTIYIKEAHASDEWKLGNIIDIPQHKNLNDRCEAAKLLTKKYNYLSPVVVDTMDNAFMREMASWPERYYIIKDGKIFAVCDVDNEFGHNRLLLRRTLRILLGYDQDNQPEVLRSDANPYCCEETQPCKQCIPEDFEELDLVDDVEREFVQSQMVVHSTNQCYACNNCSKPFVPEVAS